MKTLKILTLLGLSVIFGANALQTEGAIKIIDAVLAIASFIGLIIYAFKIFGAATIMLLIAVPALAQDFSGITGSEHGWWPFFGAGVLGIMAHIINKVRDLFTGQKATWQDIKEKPMWVNHIMFGIFALIVVAAAVSFRTEIQTLYPITLFTTFMLGYGADSAFKNWSKFKNDEKAK